MKNLYKNKNSKNKLINFKGFTLMEIIIVIAIIAILAVIAIPQITGYVETAKEASDLMEARSVILAAQVAVVEASSFGEIPAGTIVTIGWSTNPSSPTYGKVFIGEAGNEGEKSAVLPSGYVPNKSNDFTGIRDSIIAKAGGKVSAFTYLNYGYIDFEFPDSKAASKTALYIHIDSSTGEMALAGQPSNANKNYWIDEMGLDITPVP